MTMLRKSLAALVALLAAGPVAADPLLSMKGDKPFQSKTYYQASEGASCPGTNVCTVFFPKLEGKDGVIFRRVSCTVTHQASVALASLGVADKKGDSEIAASATFEIPTPVAYGSLRYTQINQEALFRVPGGKLPAVIVLVTAPSGLDVYCTISGEPG